MLGLFGVLAFRMSFAMAFLGMGGVRVRLAEFLGFVPFVALAGHEGQGDKSKQQGETFHRAP